MIEFKFEVDPCPEILSLLKDFRRVQISRFPIFAWVSSARGVNFVDSRYDFADVNNTKDLRRIVGRLEISNNNNGSVTYSLYSPNILNKRFRKNSPEANTQQTTDAKKAFKLLRDFVRPVDVAQDIQFCKGREYGSTHAHKRNSWKEKPLDDIRYSARNLDVLLMTKEFIRLRNLGVTFEYEKMDRIAEQAEEGFAEYETRVFSDERTYVMINPDHTVMTLRVNKAQAPVEEPKEYPDFDSLPDDIQSKITLLRMAGVEKEYLGNVGYMVSSHEFWLDLSR